MRPDFLPGGFDPADIAPPSTAHHVNDGGPAYPVEVDSTQPGGRQTGNTQWQAYGMSMRDAFAIAALQSLASAAQDETITSLEDRAADTARACYTIADAMLRARATPGATHGN